jgi:hypothetical protein
MNQDREQLIAARAYQLWEEEGRPHGAHARHWEQARREVEATERKKPGARPKAKPAAKPRGTATPAGAKSKSAAAPKAKAAAASAKSGEAARVARSAAAGKRAKRPAERSS